MALCVAVRHSSHTMKNPKRNIYTGIILLLICIGVYFSFTTSKDEQLQVGVVLPITGKFADISEDVLNAIALAKDRFVELSVSVEDSAGEPSKATTALINLIHIKKSKVILSGPGGSTSNTAMMPIALKEQVPLVAVSSASALRGKEDYVFTAYPFIQAETDAISARLTSQNKKTVSIIYDASSDTQVIGVEIFRRSFEASGGKVILAETYNKDIEYRTLTSKLVRSNPDAIFVLAADKITGQFVKHIREQSYTDTIIGFSTAESDIFLTTAGMYANDFETSSAPFSCDRNQHTQKYCALYRARYSKEPTAFGAYAYDALHLIAVAYETCKDRVNIGLCITSADISTSSLTESFSLDKNGDLSGNVPIHMKKVVDGKFVLIR